MIFWHHKLKILQLWPLIELLKVAMQTNLELMVLLHHILDLKDMLKNLSHLHHL